MREALRQLRTSTFARHAAWMLLFNLLSKGIAVFGNGYAARCLGATNLGMSAVVLNLSQQGLLVCNGGFDNVAVREIAKAPDKAVAITRTVTGLRLLGALALSLAWIAVSCAVGSAIPLHVRLLAVPLLLLGAAGIPFAFQGLERLPVQTMIGTVVSLLAACGFFLFFRPPMPAGSDLVVLGATTLAGLALSCFFFVRITGRSPFGRLDLAAARGLLAMSWRYWITAAAIFVYGSLQIPLITHFMGLEKAGVFRAVMVLISGIDILYSSINSLLLPRLVRWHHAGLSVMQRNQARLLGLYSAGSLAISTILMAGAPLLYHVLFGAQFHEGIPVFRILVFSRAVAFVGQIYTYGMVALHLDGELLAATLITAAASVPLNLLCISRFGLAGAAWTNLSVEALVVALSVAFLLRSRRAAPSAVKPRT